MARIVHLGLGNFHRAHQAWYTHHANRIAGTDWRITGVAMSRPDLRDAMADGAGYTLAERGADGLCCTRITLHDRVLVAAEDPEAVIEAMADPEVQIITLTITEKGYHLGPDGTLDLAAPAIAADLAAPLPRSAVGLLAHALARRAGAAAPVTVLSCDNLSHNGQKLSRAVADYAAAANLPQSRACSFPDSMVDRITPATTQSVREEIAAATGASEPAPVLTEAFSEWVIEDRFAGPRPAWDRAGAVITAEVGPFEARKLLCLNGAHSALAYGGLLCGHAYVHEAFADPALRPWIEALWQEAGACLPALAAADLPAYLSALAARFSVAEMRHRLDQIACDGSQKIPQRITPILAFADPSDAPAARAALAAWIAYLLRVGGTDAMAADPGAQALLEAADTRNLSEFVPQAMSRVCAAQATPELVEAVTRDVAQWLSPAASPPAP